MNLFNKKTNNEPCCGLTNEEDNKSQSASVKVLGSGCAKCNQLEKNTVEALKELSMDTKIEHVREYVEIASYGVMSTPALVIDDKVVSYGKVLTKDEVIKILKNVRS
ncbi:MAG: thioredoxin family protein [Erysipelotrichaceae bacterium]|nr:thioredoxin family protein [Erysipelotrichaceae bacterium]